MPKLNPNLASEVKTAGESSGFTPLEEGRYRIRLVEVAAKNAASSGNPMWTWKLEVLGLEDGTEKYKGRNLWVNTVLTDKALWKVAEVFAAFGVDTDTDTDELLGCTAVAVVIQRMITQGQRAGQIGNDVSRLDPDRFERAVRHPNSEIEGGTAKVSDGTPAPTPETVDQRF